MERCGLVPGEEDLGVARMKPDGPDGDAGRRRGERSPVIAVVVAAVHAILESDEYPARPRGIDDDRPHLRRRRQTRPERLPEGFAAAAPIQPGSDFPAGRGFTGETHVHAAFGRSHCTPPQARAGSISPAAAPRSARAPGSAGSRRRAARAPGPLDAERLPAPP